MKTSFRESSIPITHAATGNGPFAISPACPEPPTTLPTFIGAQPQTLTGAVLLQQHQPQTDCRCGPIKLNGGTPVFMLHMSPNDHIRSNNSRTKPALPRSRDYPTVVLILSTLLINLLLFTPPAWSLSTSAIKDKTCAGYRSGTTLNCTAGEFTVGANFSAAPGTPPFCVAGQAFNFKVDLRLYGSNANRYDIGFFAGQQNNDPGLTTAGDICSVATFPTTPSPWLNLDGDGCGDYLAAGDSTITVDEIKVVCTGDSTGALQVPYLLTYWQNSGNACSGAADVTAGSTSKCNKGVSTVSGNVKVYSGAYVDVTKQTLPDLAPQTFSYKATGPVGSKVIAMVNGVYTPASIDQATDNITVSISDGQTARFFINTTDTDRPLTIEELETADWEKSSDISCPGFDTTVVTADNANRKLTANLNQTNNAVACTFTNTKRSRITLQKSVAGRIDPADQFTVSATGGGTITGATSVTTTGNNPTATTTFHSTPATSLTLTDSKANGPTPLTNYDTVLTCTNAYSGPGATLAVNLPTGVTTTSANITPAPGDDITCIFTNSARPALSKAFASSTIGVGQTTPLTFTISNPDGAPARSGLTFTDSLPSGLVIANPTGVANSCGGTPTISATAGNSTFSVGGSGVNAAAGASSCTISVNVTSSTPLSGYVNGPAQITAISGFLLNGVTSQTLDVVQASLNKSFSPATIDQGETSTLTFTLTNGSGNPAQSGINFTDTLPSTVTVAASPNITTTCPSGTGVVSSPAGASSITVTGASMSSGQTACTISVDVTSNIPGGPYYNTSANISGSVRLTNSITSSSLTVQAKPTLTKEFGSSTIGVGQSTPLTFTITNPVGAPARSGLTFTDSFPVNLAIAGSAGIASSCGGTPTFTATSGTGTFTVGGGGVTVAAGPSSCTISVNVTSSTPLSGYLNGPSQITAIHSKLLNGVSTQQLNVVQASLDKAFSPTNILVGGTSTLTFTLSNSGSNPAQSGISFTDTLPANVTVASLPNITSTCPSGSGVVAATPGSGIISITGATLANGQAACVITVDVTSNTLGGPYNNSSSNISASYHVTNSVTGTSLTVTNPLPLISILKSANMAKVNPGQTIVYTVQLTNSGTGAGSAVVIRDDLSPYAAFSLNSYGNGLPFSFTDSAPPCGLGLGTPEYSSNNGTTWLYTPVSGGGGAPPGYDANITNWRIPMTGTIRSGGSFNLNYQVIVK